MKNFSYYRPCSTAFLSVLLFSISWPNLLEAQTTAPRLVRLANTTHPRATPASDRGKVPDDFPVNRVLIVLKRSTEQQSDLETFLARLQNPASPEYHRWLKPEGFGQRFGAVDRDIRTVTGWLASQGLVVNRVGKGGAAIEFSGTAGTVGQAFHTEIHKFSLEGRDHWANSGDISVPETVATLIEGVALLNDFKDYHSGAVLQYEPEGKNLDKTKPLLRGGSGRYYLIPSDFNTIYSIPSTYTGSGVTIGVVGDADFDTDNVDDFRARFGLPANTPTKFYDGVNPGTGGATGEAMLDVTWSGAIAPGATVAYVGATSIFLSEGYIVDNNLADIVTESFGVCEADLSPAGLSLINSFRAQAAAQGITWVQAAGDAGPYGCEDFHSELSYSVVPVLAVSALAASPFVVAVGGTQFNTTGSSTNYWSASNAALGYFPEAAWNQSCYFNAACFTSVVAGGGGQSTQPGGKPSWQAAVGVGPTMMNDNARDIPDVSFTSSWQIDPYVICLNRSCENATSFGFYWTGGTSAATPSFAGIVALVEQRIGGRLGAINPVLYALAASQFSQCLGVASSTSGCVYNDIVTGNTATPGASSAYYPATKGYDMATGLGSVNVTNLLNLWNAGTLTKTTTQFSISPGTFVHGSAAQITISVAPQSGNGIPSGPVTLLAGASQLICPGTILTRMLPDGCVSVAVPSLLTNGSSQSSLQGLPGGSYTVTAAYGGDGSFAPSVSAPVQVVISPETSSITVKSSLTTATYGTPVGVIATVAGPSNSGIPTGTVTFYDNGSALGTAVPNTFGTAIFVVSTISPGSHSITASYTGDQSFSASTTAIAAAVQVQAAATFVNVENVCASAGGMVTPTLSYTGTGTMPTGSIVYSVAGVAIATVPLNSQNQAPFTVPAGFTPLPAAIQASYSGDANYAPSAPLTINVGLTDCAGVLVDSATSTHLAAVGGIATIYGVSMASATASAPTPAWPMTLGGATVSITDSNNQTAQAQLSYVSPGQINLCVPSSLSPGVVTIQVGGTATSNPFQATIQSSSPVIFAAQTITVSGGTVSATEPLAPIVIPSQGTVYLILYATGVRNHSATSLVEVSIGNALIGTYAVEPAYAGTEGIFPGLDQINFLIPSKLARSGDATVAITIVDSQTGTILQESNPLALSFPNQ